MLTQQNKYFQLRDTSFSMEGYKVATARQVFFTEFKINNSFTLENSFFKKYNEKEIEQIQQMKLEMSAQKKLNIPVRRRSFD